MKKLAEWTPAMVLIVRIMISLFLMAGSIMGFPNDPAMGGMFWLFTGIWTLMEVLA